MSFFDDARVDAVTIKDPTGIDDSSLPEGIIEGEKGTNRYHEFRRIVDNYWRGGDLVVKYYGDADRVRDYLTSPLRLEQVSRIAEELSKYAKVAYSSTQPSLRDIDEEGNPVFPGDTRKVAGVAAQFRIAAAYSIY